MPPIIATKEDITPAPKRWGFGVIVISLFLLAGAYFLYTFAQQPPANFPVDSRFVIEPGTSIKQVATDAKAANLTRSLNLLYFILVTKYRETPPQASTYLFEKPLTVEELATSFAKGDHDTDLVTLTIPEGTSLKDIARIAEKSLPNFNGDNFLAIAVGQEGYLFPETYFVPSTYTEEDLYTLLNDTFSEKIQTLEPALSNHNLTLTEIVILASIIEREANTIESMKMVSGILQERLSIGMPLQVDASMEYVLEKPLSELTAEDLKTASPYNTYLNKGLPPSPIGNPGLDSIKAVLEPTPSDYMFYITGNDGNFYYAKTFEGHKNNITRYLR
jgi:UPF0755 protein